MKKTITLLAILIATTLFAQTTYVPDDNFEQALINLGYDSGALDDYVPTANISGVTSLNVHSKNIANLSGIEDFTALTDLRCHNNQLTSLDISNNTTLTELWCSSNQLTSLDITTNTALTKLYCYSNQLTNLDVSNNTALTKISCTSNQLMSLDLTTNTALTELYCPFNQLTGLDISNNTALTNLQCFSNQITSLDLTNNTALTELWCSSNELTSLNVKNGNNTNMPNANFDATNNPNLTCIEVDDAAWSTTNWTNIDATANFSEHCVGGTPMTYVPDDNFEQALINLGYDSGALDDYVPTANISGITTLYISFKNIADLTGIQDFTALTNLSCHNNPLGSLDITHNTALTTLNCSYNGLTNSLDVTHNTALITLKCYSNSITDLDVSQNTALVTLKCYSNPLGSLDVTQNTALETLDCHSNGLTNSLDVTHNTALVTLKCYSNSITDLDITHNTALETLDCQINSLGSLDLSQNTVLTTLNCHTNPLGSLDVTHNTALETLDCHVNSLGSLDLSQNTALSMLICSTNSITDLDLSQNVALNSLYCSSNDLTSLNVQNSNNTNIDPIDFNTTNNPDLTCILVDDAAWSTANWPDIDATSTFVNNQAACDALYVADNTFETQLSLYPNPVKDSFSIINNSNKPINQITIYNLLGEMVLKTIHTNAPINTRNLKAGVYIVKLSSGKAIASKK